MLMSVRKALVSMPTLAEIWLVDTSASVYRVGRAKTVTSVSREQMILSFATIKALIYIFGR